MRASTQRSEADDKLVLIIPDSPVICVPSLGVHIRAVTEKEEAIIIAVIATKIPVKVIVYITVCNREPGVEYHSGVSGTLPVVYAEQ